MSSNQPTKILYLVTLSEWGGAQKYLFDLANCAQNQGFAVSAAVGGDKNGELIKLLVRSNIQTYYLHHLQRSIHPLREILTLFDLIKLIRKVKPNIVHLNSSKAGSLGALAAKLCGVKKIIYTVHGLVLNEPLSPLQRAFYSFSEHFTARFKNKFICVSEYDRNSLLKYKITKPEKITVIHNGLDLDQINFFEKPEAQAKLSSLTGQDLAQAGHLIGTIANFYPVKGLNYLVEAAKEVIAIHPKTKFVIIGTGLLEKQLKQMILEYRLQDNIILAGALPEASHYLKAFDLFVLPSLKEGLAYALLEASAAGLPIITTSVGGNPEVVVDNFNGLLVPPADFSTLAEKIINLLPDQNRLSLFSKNSQQKIKDFSLSEMCQKTIELYF